jgi:hypothetical protein
MVSVSVSELGRVDTSAICGQRGHTVYKWKDPVRRNAIRLYLPVQSISKGNVYPIGKVYPKGRVYPMGRVYLMGRVYPRGRVYPKGKVYPKGRVFDGKSVS